MVKKIRGPKPEPDGFDPAEPRRTFLTMAEAIAWLKTPDEEMEAELDAEHLATDADAQEALKRGVDQITRGEGLSPDEVRTRLGRPRRHPK